MGVRKLTTAEYLAERRRMAAGEDKPAAFYLGSSKKTKKQHESVLQRQIIDTIHKLSLGEVHRIRNGATFDANTGRYRSNVSEKGIPDIIGNTKTGRAIYIEVKYIRQNSTKGRSEFRYGKLSMEQADFLSRKERSGCIVGVAHDIHDAIAIIRDNFNLYPRSPRTYAHKDKTWLDAYKLEYLAKKKELAQKNKDPILKPEEILPEEECDLSF